jgi:nucleotide-binding universal stress UspA family protein
MTYAHLVLLRFASTRPLRRFGPLVFHGSLLAACQTSARHESVPSSTASTPAATAPAAELDRLDARIPVPLLPMMAHHQKQNMRDHLAVVQEVVSATAERDFAKVTRAAERIGYTEAMGQMCQHMGAGAPGFTEQALAFHHNADLIVEGAKRQDAQAVLRALGETLTKCTTCHATYKQQLVEKLDGHAGSLRPAANP